jgi:hypothetical protein
MTNTTISPKRHKRTLLWTALLVSAACNAATSILGSGTVGTVVSVAFGVLTVAFGAGLVAHYRGR